MDASSSPFSSTNSPSASIRGRGSQINPVNRFERIEVEHDLEQLETDDEFRAEWSSGKTIATEYFVDDSKSLLSENDSPDVFFRYSMNPYRGCAHGCAYCYARPSHEYLGLSAGLDFETKVLVKLRAPQLLRDHLGRDKWDAEPIMMSGVTDCYQPAERTFRLTRQCLEVALEARQPICMVTKNALVTRDIDLLRQMAEMETISVAVSITTLDPELSRVMEPRTSHPAARLRAIRELTDAGVPTMVMVAPVIPGLNDSEIPNILKAARESGAISASYVLLRLPLTVRPIFMDWLERTQPLKRERVESRIRSTRDGELNDAQFGSRMRGTGEIASQIQQTFRVFARHHGLDRKRPSLNTTHFRPPRSASGQLRLF